MIACMAALRSTYFGTKQPPREAIAEKLTQAILHGFLHRDGRAACVPNVHKVLRYMGGYCMAAADGGIFAFG